MKISGIYNYYYLNKNLSHTNSTNSVSSTTSTSSTAVISTVKETESTNQTNNSSNQQSSPPEKKTPPEIAAFMAKLGLSPTNSKEGDDQAITTKLQQLGATAKTDGDKQRVNSLKAEFQALVCSMGQNASMQQSSLSSTGTDQLAALNKHFLVQSSS